MRIFVVFVVYIFSGIVNAQDTSYYDLFKNFTAMKNPQTYVPVGARWIPGIGPDGDPEPEDNLVTSSKGLSTGIINSSLKSQLTISLMNYLGLKWSN